MPSSLSMYTRSQMMRAVFTPDIYVPPTGLLVALTKNIPPNNATAAQLIEPTVAGYVRETYGLTSAYWAPTNFGELYNTTRIEYNMVVDQSWGMIAGWALVDPGSGQCLNTGSIRTPYEAIIGSVPYLDPGTLVLGIYD